MLDACNTTGNRGFVVRHERTAKAIKRTALSLSCVFRRGARQRAHGKGHKTHGNLFVVRFSPGRTTKSAR
jgi:hypothetical protein